MPTSESSKITYRSMLKKVWLDDIDEPSMEKLMELSLPSRKTASMAIIHKMRELEKFSQEEIDVFGKVAKDARILDNLKRVNRPATEQEQENVIRWENVISIRNQLENNRNISIQNHIKYIMLCLFTYLPPNRGEIYINCYINQKIDDESNTLDIPNKKFIIRKHKTSHRKGGYEIYLESPLIDILTEWSDITKRYNNRLLFVKDGQPMSSKIFTEKMYNIFNKKISTDMLRKIYITQKRKENPNMSMQELQDLAASMHHSLTQQELTYYKKDLKIPDKQKYPYIKLLNRATT